MRIAILDDYQNVALRMADWASLGTAFDVVSFNDHQKNEVEIAARLKDFDAVVIMRERTPFPRSLIEKLPRLRLLITTGPRNASIDLQAAAEHGVTVCGTESHSFSTVELAWALIMSVTRGIPQQDASMRQGGWQLGLGRQLHGMTLGVIGLGRLGSAIARIGQAFGMNIIAWSQNLTEERAAEVGVTRAASKDELLKAADVITIHLVLGDRTRGLIDRAAFGQMKPSAYLVNTSRAPIVDQEALLDALTNGRIAGAGLDVFEVEPLPADHPLRRLPNTVLTPHIGYVSQEQYRLFYGQAVEDIAAFNAGTPVRVLAAPKG